jgi:hypothetical protein
MKKKVLFEDTVSMYNRWVSGQAAREFSAIKMKFNDLLDKDKGSGTQSPNDVKASNVLPYPLPNTVFILGDLITNHTNASTSFKDALTHPLIKDDEKAKQELQAIIACLNKSLNELKQIFVILNKSAEDEA